MNYTFSSAILPKKELRQYNHLYNAFMTVMEELTTETLDVFLHGPLQNTLEEKLAMALPQHLDDTECEAALSFIHRYLNRAHEHLNAIWNECADNVDIETRLEKTHELIAADLTWLITPTIGLSRISHNRLRKDI